MSKTEANSLPTAKKLTVDSLQSTVQDKKEGKRLNAEDSRGTERTEKAEGRKEVEESKVEESKRERKIGANSGVEPLLPTPAFEDGKHHIKIYQGDCLEILAKIPEDTVDLVFADPPYFPEEVKHLGDELGRMVFGD